jgi:Methylamine utilisation protein MauE
MALFSRQPVFDPDPPMDAGSGLPIPSAGQVPMDGEDGSLSEGVDSAHRREVANEPKPDEPPKYLFARISVVLIMLVWVAAGFYKISDMSRFMDIVNQHQVIPEDMKAFLWWVGPGELVMGLLLVFVVGSELRKPFGKFVLLLSFGGIIGFTYYLSLVDPVVLQESGCGCLSDYRIASGMENSVRFFAYGKNVILMILHLVALFGPAMVDSRRRSG